MVASAHEKQLLRARWMAGKSGLRTDAKSWFHPLDSIDLELVFLFHVGLDLQLFNEGLDHGPALAAALFKVLLQTLVLRAAETHLNIGGSKRTRRPQLVVL